MSKVKQPKTLQILAIEALGTSVLRASQSAIDAYALWRYSPWRALAALGIGSGKAPEINTSGLHQYLYGDLPHSLSCEVTKYILSAVIRLLKLTNYTDIKIMIEPLILACVYPHITVLEMCGLPNYAHEILSCNIHTFEKLHTLRLSPVLPTHVLETLPIGLSYLKFLLDFSMYFSCTDAIVNTLGSCCSTTIEHIRVISSVEVTDESFRNLMNCSQLKRLLINDTSVTAEGYLQFLQNIRQHKKSGDKTKGLLHIDLGSFKGWDVTTRQLDEVAISCPMLKKIEIRKLDGDMEALVSLTTLEVLDIYECDFHQCNFGGFLRVRGCNVTSLQFEETYSIDLTCIMNNCINIKRLYVNTGSIVTTSLEITENVAKACQNLEILDLCTCEEFSASSIERMLYACVNLTLLSLGYLIDDNIDDFILRLLSNNPLRKLTRFSAAAIPLDMSFENAFCPEWTMTSVYAVIEHCSLLKDLEYYYCYKITDAEIKRLKQQIKDKNQDLELNFCCDYE